MTLPISELGRHAGESYLVFLSRLDLNGTRVSQSGVTELRKSLPNTVISL
jgi:hypothetical protein